MGQGITASEMTPSDRKRSILYSAAVARSSVSLRNSGVTANSLRTWRDRALGKGRVAQAGSAEPKGRSEASLTDPAGEIRRLQREVEYLRRQREILKKAMSILSEEPQSGMR